MKNRSGSVNSQILAFFFVLISLVVGVFGFLGWVFNIMILATMNFDKITGEHVIRIVGIFMPPVGAFAGWFL